MVHRFSVALGSLVVALLAFWLIGAGLPGPATLGSASPAGLAHASGASPRDDRGPGVVGRLEAPVSAAVVRAARGSAFPVSPPYQERGRFGPAGASAFAYRVSLREGDTLRVTVTDAWGGADPSAFRLVAFRAGDLERASPRPLGGFRGDGILELPVVFDGDVVVVLHGGGAGTTFTTRIDRSGALLFPVAGRSADDLIGHFLDLRDGGRRLHHGVDIAAPEGNPVRAVANGIIERVETTPLGGLTIRLTEARTGYVHYFAHLAAAFVGPGQRVVAGQTIGAVGNTGNARNSPPHLHYAVFDGSDILDPMKVLRPPAPTFAAAAPSELLGGHARIRIPGAALRASPTNIGPATSLALDEPVEVLAETGNYLRVRVGERKGFVTAWVVGT